MDLAELLPLYALGALDDAEAAEVARAVAGDPALAAELETLLTASVDLAAAAPGLAPSPAVRDRLLASVDTRFERFVARMSELFDVAADRARELFRLIDRKDAWEPGPTPGSWLIHFTAGPALAGADTGFVRLAPGERFAWHRHTGDEQNLVLAGVADDSLSGRLTPGAEAFAPAGTEHDFVNVGDEDFVFAVWVWGVDFDTPRPR
jgi:mannose-6-phosphate isomerase-like protein (cupin superfamily)